MDRKTLLETPITNRAAATNYIRCSVELGITYHYEDSASDIVNATDEPLFTAEEAVHAEARATDLFKHLDDPLAVLNLLDPPADLPTVVLPATQQEVPAGLTLKKVKQQNTLHGGVEISAELWFTPVDTDKALCIAFLEDRGNGGGTWARPNLASDLLIAHVIRRFALILQARGEADPLCSETLWHLLLQEHDIAKTLSAKVKRGKRLPVLKGLDSLRKPSAFDNLGSAWNDIEWLEAPTTLQALLATATRAKAQGITHVWNGSEWQTL